MVVLSLSDLGNRKIKARFLKIFSIFYFLFRTLICGRESGWSASWLWRERCVLRIFSFDTFIQAW